MNGDILRRLSRFELKQVAKKLAEKCGGDHVLESVVQLVAQSNPLTLANEEIGETKNTKNTKTENRKRKEEETETAAVKKNTVKETKEKKQRKDKKGGKQFDMGYFAQRHIALHVAYFGENYGGFVTQASRADTVEQFLFDALTRSCLIVDIAEANYSRCGRTDAGVSALGQIVSLTVRSNLKNPLPSASTIPPSKERPTKKQKITEDPISLEKDQIEDATKVESDDDEINYSLVLNKLLPDDVRVIGWAPCPTADFKARFNAEYRTYRYYFASRGLDIEAMRAAAKNLEGVHDFRNFCKMDVTNVKNFVREIAQAEIRQCTGSTSPNDPVSIGGMYFLEIRGTAFLWHQIRCIVAVLFLVGRRQESSEVVSDLLDLTKFPRKPVYDIAPGEPLILYESEYPDLVFRYDEDALNKVREKLEYRISKYAIHAEQARGVLHFVDNKAHLTKHGNQSLLEAGLAKEIDMDIPYGHGMPAYVKIADRKTCDSYEERVDNMSDKKRGVVKRRHGWEL